MNFLAHIYLSGQNPLVTLGNFMADGIKGKQYLNYNNAVIAGIKLHRDIDTFTDAHPIVRQSTKRLHKNYSHYSGVIVDIFYDHYLAKNWQNYHVTPLDIYIQEFYSILKLHKTILPQSYSLLTEKMMLDNWLLSYATTQGIQNVLNGMNRRTKGRSKMNEATKELNLFYKEFEADFTLFFEDLKTYSSQQLAQYTIHYKL